MIPALILAGLATAATAAANAAKDAVEEQKRRLENTALEQKWWNENKERLRTTSCPPGQFWIHQKDPSVEFYRYDLNYPLSPASAVAPVPGAARYMGYCVPDPKAKAQAEANFWEQVRQSRADQNDPEARRARQERQRVIDGEFARLIAQGTTPDEVMRYIRETYQYFITPGNWQSEVNRNQTLINEARVRFNRSEDWRPPPTIATPAPGAAPGEVPPVNSSLTSTILAGAILTSPFWFPYAAKLVKKIRR